MKNLSNQELLETQNLPNQELLKTHNWENLNVSENINGREIASAYGCKRCNTLMTQIITNQPESDWIMYNAQITENILYGKIFTLDPKWWTCEFVRMSIAIK